jgi:nucleotide-binding universal stress UspA family protein
MTGPILVGVDTSTESTHAAETGWRLSQSLLVDCYFVHATRDIWASARQALSTATATAVASPTAAAPEFDAALVEAAHTRMARILQAKLPADTSAGLRVEVGRAGLVLERLARALGAELVVLGGKHHTALGRWLGGSTAHHLARVIDIPILITVDPHTTFRRLLAAVDLAESARTVLSVAEQFASSLDADLRAIHVVPASDSEPPGTTLDQAELMSTSTAILEQSIWTALQQESTERVVRHGDPIQKLREEIQTWSADLLVVGSHGEGFADHSLLGSVTEAILEDLPTSVLIVPVMRR